MLADHEMSFQKGAKQPANKSLEVEMYTGGDLYHFVGFGCTLIHKHWCISDPFFVGNGEGISYLI